MDKRDSDKWGSTGIKSQKLYKQVNDQKTIETKWNSMVIIEQKLANCKAFAICILIARL